MLEAIRRVKAEREAELNAADKRFVLRGNNLAIQTLNDPEALLVGAAGTGKTLGILIKLDKLMRTYRGARALIVRKVRADLAQTTLVTYERDVLGLENPICVGVQRESRHSYKYPNGSEVVVGGMDRPGKILSAEYDFIYPAEAVQFEEEDWETFTMRVARRDVIPFPQVVGDTNPDRPDHWLKKRCDEGKTRLLPTSHKDNPAFWDDVAEDWTPLGRRYVLERLASLTSVRRKRFFDGEWAGADGAVFEGWNSAIHLINDDPMKAWGLLDADGRWHFKRVIASVDWGFTNPGVIEVWGVDGDGRIYLIRQVYMTGRLIEWWVERAKALRAAFSIERFECDPSEPGFIEAFNRAGLRAMKAQNGIREGIDAVNERLAVAKDGRPRLYVLRSSLAERDEALADEKKPLSLQDEITGYVWAKSADGKVSKEQPQAGDDHALDALRYACMYAKQATARVRSGLY